MSYAGDNFGSVVGGRDTHIFVLLKDCLEKDCLDKILQLVFVSYSLLALKKSDSSRSCMLL